MKPYQFLPPQKENNDRNWRGLIENTYTKNFVPILTNKVNSPTVAPAYYVVMGPLVYITYTLFVPNLAGWTANAELQLPMGLTPSVGGVSVATAFFPVIKQDNTVIQQAVAYLDGTPAIKLLAGYTNVSGSSETLGISGWYLRNA